MTPAHTYSIHIKHLCCLACAVFLLSFSVVYSKISPNWRCLHVERVYDPNKCEWKMFFVWWTCPRFYGIHSKFHDLVTDGVCFAFELLSINDAKFPFTNSDVLIREAKKTFSSFVFLSNSKSTESFARHHKRLWLSVDSNIKLTTGEKE